MKETPGLPKLEERQWEIILKSYIIGFPIRLSFLVLGREPISSLFLRATGIVCFPFFSLVGRDSWSRPTRRKNENKRSCHEGKEHRLLAHMGFLLDELFFFFPNETRKKKEKTAHPKENDSMFGQPRRCVFTRGRTGAGTRIIFNLWAQAACFVENNFFFVPDPVRLSTSKNHFFPIVVGLCLSLCPIRKKINVDGTKESKDTTMRKKWFLLTYENPLLREYVNDFQLPRDLHVKISALGSCHWHFSTCGFSPLDFLSLPHKTLSLGLIQKISGG